MLTRSGSQIALYLDVHNYKASFPLQVKLTKKKNRDLTCPEKSEIIKCQEKDAIHDPWKRNACHCNSNSNSSQYTVVYSSS